MKQQQLVMDLPVRTARGREDFFVTGSNQLALRQIDLWRNWAGSKLVLTGPKGSGKSHLVAVWAELSGARVLTASKLGCETVGHVAVEDVDLIAGQAEQQEALFHLHNRVLTAGHSLLLTGCGPPQFWGLDLPDLASRVMASDIAQLDQPDDTLLGAILIKLFSDRQLIVQPDVISYMVNHIDRSYVEAERVVALLDEASMREQKRITPRFVGSILKDGV